jgi:putative aldouronate transport system permease protein
MSKAVKSRLDPRTRRANSTKKRRSFWVTLWKQRFLVILLIPGLLNFVIWHYIPMYGVTLAFKDYSMRLGIFGSPWAADFGLRHLVSFINYPYFWRMIWNTVSLNLLLTFFLPLPGIVFALSLNEIMKHRFKRVVQTVSYFPYFLSSVAVVGIFTVILSPSTGVVNSIIKLFGGQPIYFLMEAEFFRPLMLGMSAWQAIGWDTIIWLARIATIDPQLYESATVDGAGRLKKMWFITLPAFKEWYVIGLILSFGSLLASSGFEKNLLLYQANPGIVAQAETIGIYLYKRGIADSQFSYGAMVGFANMVVCLLMLLIGNLVSRRLTEEAIW